jgi:hypothetical protein
LLRNMVESREVFGRASQSAIETIRSMVEERDAIVRVAAQGLRSLMEGVERTVKTFQTVDPWAEVRAAFLTFEGTVPFAVQATLKSISGSEGIYKRILQDSIPKDFFEETFREALFRYAQAELEFDDEEVDAADRVLKELRESAPKAATSLLKADFYLSQLIAIVLFIIALHGTTQSEQRLTTQINEVKDAIAELQRLRTTFSTPDTSTYYVVERQVKLCKTSGERPPGHAKTLYPNQKVRLVDRKHKWVLVEYYNYSKDLHENGWCRVKYLKRLKPKGGEMR